MGKFIVKLGGKYLEWSTNVDAPVTFGMTREEFERHYLLEYGRDGATDLASRLERVDAKGTSAHDDESADDTVWLNRAGPGETRLHRDEMIEFFVRRKRNVTPEKLAKFREGLERCGPRCPTRPDANGCASHCTRCWGTDYVRPLLNDPCSTRAEGK